jgi:hypothetical protein
LLDRQEIEHPHAFYAQLRRECLVVVGGTGVFLVASAPLVDEALERTEKRSSA